jgi:hypothetical protein
MVGDRLLEARICVREGLIMDEHPGHYITLQ